MTLKLTPKKQQELYEKMTQHLDHKVREMFEPCTIASRLYPHLTTKPVEPEQPKRGPIDGWAKQRKEWE
jgi:hypothetical protein